MFCFTLPVFVFFPPAHLCFMSKLVSLCLVGLFPFSVTICQFPSPAFILVSHYCCCICTLCRWGWVEGNGMGVGVLGVRGGGLDGRVSDWGAGS